MSTISLPTSCLLDKSVVREALRGLVRETLSVPLPPGQGTSLGVVRALIAYGGLLYITLELWHLLERPANLTIASPFLYAHGFPRIETRFVRMIRQLKAPYQQATLPDVGSAEELRAHMAL